MKVENTFQTEGLARRICGMVGSKNMSQATIQTNLQFVLLEHAVSADHFYNEGTLPNDNRSTKLRRGLAS